MRKKKCSAACRAEFEAVMSRIEQHASVQFRHVKCPGRRDEMIAETLALSWKWWVSLWDRGKEWLSPEGRGRLRRCLWRSRSGSMRPKLARVAQQISQNGRL